MKPLLGCGITSRISCLKPIFLLFILAVFSITAFPGISYSVELSGYHIGSGDVLEISVWKEETLSREIVVPPDLVISFPLIGDIDIATMTVADLRQAITKRLQDFVLEATVTVLLRQINSMRAYVIGKVNKPGQFPIDMDTTALQLLAMAGGLNPFASESSIFILRNDKGVLRKIPFNYHDIEKGRNLSQNITLRRGDVIVVP